MLAKLADRRGFAGVAGGPPLRSCPKLRAQAGFAQPGFLRKIRERGQRQVGDLSTLLLQTADHRETGKIVSTHRAIQFLFFDSRENGVPIQQRDAGISIEAGDT